MTDLEYEKGIKEIGNGIYAYLRPDGSWGLNNAGLIADGGESLLIDTPVRSEIHRRHAERHEGRR